MSPGKKLQAAREAKGIALGDVSRDTRISAATLKGLEEEDFKFLPRGIYVRAFIKTYCGVLGLEAKVILDEFVEKYPDEVGQIVKSDTVTAFANEEYGKRQVAAAITIVVTVLSVVCLVVVVYQNCLTPLGQCCDAGCAASCKIIKNDISRIGVNANYAIDDPKRFLRWIASFFSSVGTDNRVPPRIRWCFTF